MGGLADAIAGRTSALAVKLIEEQLGARISEVFSRFDIQPEGLHQRVAVFLGSKEEVARITAYHKA